ncbi:MAG: primosomal protein N' [Pseudomonadales bacterium]
MKPQTEPQVTRDAFAADIRVVRVAVPVPLRRLFDYAMATNDPSPTVGARVRVPFGRQRLVGICIEIDPQDAHDALKPLDSVIDTEPALDAELMRLGRWLSDYYHYPLGEVLHSLLPAPGRRGEPLSAPVVVGYRTTGSVGDLSRAIRQQALLDLLQEGPQSRQQILAQDFSATVIGGLLDKGLIEKCSLNPAQLSGSQSSGTQSSGNQSLETPLTPSPEQAAAIAALRARIDCFAPTLLEGVTGSGKTEVYLQLIETVMAAGRQVLMLVPEIALTPQTVARFANRFGQADTLHSQVSDGDRLRIWDGCRRGAIKLLIGTRSAALTPFANLGLIIVDEEHDGSFKQNDGLRYSARDLAVKRAADAGLPLVLGSATPSLESLNNVARGRYAHLLLNERAGGADFAELKLIDIRGQRLSDGISNDLRRAISHHLQAGNQVLVFINRRGYAPSLLCGSCSNVVSCPDCDRAMTYHRSAASAGGDTIICHHCGRRGPAPAACPACSMATLIPVGVGTQRSEAALAEMFPDVPLYRVDRDTARSKARLDAHFEAIRSGEPAILVGTQILAKGHHFPAVTLVAMLNADAGFAAADYRAPERTAALIIQVAGRAGRAERPGEVWIQTLQPEHPLLNALLTHGYRGFAQQELGRRQEAGLPPSTAMALIRAEADSASAPERLLTTLRGELGKALQAHPDSAGQVELLGPVPAPMARLAGRHRFQLLLLAPQRGILHQALTQLEQIASVDPAKGLARNVRWSIDVDPIDSL